MTRSLALALLLTACTATGPADGGALLSGEPGSNPGSAFVRGRVTTSSGQPLGSTSIGIDCREAAATGATDSVGGYLVRVDASSGVPATGVGTLPCRLRVPASGTPRIVLDTLLQFVTAPYLTAAIQTINLQER